MSPPTSLAYQWFRTPPGGTATAIGGATSSSYQVTQADAGATLTCRVTATDAAGSTTVTTVATHAVGNHVFATVPVNQRSFAVTGATTAAQFATLAPGITEVTVQASWATMQPNGPGSALDPAAVAAFTSTLSAAVASGVQVLLEYALHLAPAWVIAAVEPFTDQVGNTWLGTPPTADYVANWMWTTLGRSYVSDFVTKVTAVITPAMVTAITHITIGGGPSGHAHYPVSIANTGGFTPPATSYYAYGSSQQDGVGLAAGLAVCPLTGYVPFTEPVPVQGQGPPASIPGTSAPGGTYAQWNFSGSGYTSMQWTFEPLKDAPSTLTTSVPGGPWSDYLHYYAMEFFIENWTSAAGLGYAGFQTNGDFNGIAQGKAINFSIWSSTAGNSTNPATLILAHNTESNGVQMMLPYNWTVGHIYLFHFGVGPGGVTSAGTWWQLTVTDQTTGVVTVVGQQLFPNTIGSLPSTSLQGTLLMFGEDTHWHDANTGARVYACTDFQSSSMACLGVSANNGTVLPANMGPSTNSGLTATDAGTGYVTTTCTVTVYPVGQAVQMNLGFWATPAPFVIGDAAWIAWYIGGLNNWLQWFNTLLLSLGWTTQRVMVMHPGVGTRSNQTSSSAGYQASLAAGEMPAEVMASYQANPNMWPWCAWIDNTDAATPPVVDSDQSAWKKVYASALAVGKQNYVRGENVSVGPALPDMTSTVAPFGVFQNALATAAPRAGYPLGVTSATWQGYKGLAWRNYTALTAPSVLATLRGINYYPQGSRTSGSTQWTIGDYSPTTTAADFAKIKAAGFNVARVFLGATAGAAQFAFPTPSATQLGYLTDMCNQAIAAGITLQLSLFDVFGNYGSINASQTWAAAIIAATVPAAVSVIELQNEVNLISATAYAGAFDAGWTLSTSGVTVASATLQWCRVMIPYLRSLPNASGKPVIASTSDAAGLGVETANLTAAVAGLTGSALPTWHEWHVYQVVGGLLAAITAAKAAATTAPLRIGEVGLSLPVPATLALSAAQSAQFASDYIQTARWACATLALPEPAPWAVYDVTETTGNEWGLWDISGNPRAAVAMYATWPAGTNAPGVAINSALTPVLTDADGNTVAAHWALYRGNTGTQVITAATSGGSTTLTSPSNPATDNQPSMLAGGGQFGSGLGRVITTGESFTFSATCSGTAAPTLKIDWWNGTTANGTFISNTTHTASASGSPVSVSVTSSAPAGATTMNVSVCMPFAGGTLTVTNPTLTP